MSSVKPAGRGNQRRDRGTIDVRQLAEDRHRRGHHRAGVAGADEAVDFAALDQFHADVNRRESGLVSTDSSGESSIATTSRACSTRIARPLVCGSEFAFDDVLEADQHDLEAEIARRRHRAFHGGFGGEIAPHRVERDFQSTTPATYSFAAAARVRDRCRNGGIRDGAGWLAALAAGRGIDRPSASCARRMFFLE